MPKRPAISPLPEVATMSSDEEELYRNALEVIESAQQERERQFPKLEALRAQWKAEFEDFDGERDGLWMQCLIDCLMTEVEACLDPEKDDPVDDPAEWLEFGYEERESRTRDGSQAGDGE